MAEWIIEANDTEEAAEGKFAFIRELVRCKDCRKWCICHHSDDYFCADGERMVDDD